MALLEEQPVTAGKVTLAWTMAAGPAMARSARVRWPANGTLYLTATNDAWRREIVRAKPMLLQRLSLLLGAGVVGTIVVDATDTGETPRKRHA